LHDALAQRCSTGADFLKEKRRDLAGLAAAAIVAEISITMNGGDLVDPLLCFFQQGDESLGLFGDEGAPRKIVAAPLDQTSQAQAGGIEVEFMSRAGRHCLSSVVPW